MNRQHTMGRRSFLRLSVGASAALAWPASARAATVSAYDGAIPFVDAYRTNVLGDLSPEANAAVRILSGMTRVWDTGTAWNNGVPLMPEVLRANVRYSEKITAVRTDAQARLAFVCDRQHQSYAVIAGLGPLADLYRTGAKAVTSITSAPDGIPAAPISDAVPAGAPAGSAIGAGSTASELGKVVELVNTLRGPHASSNPSKYAYQYPRPWRLNDDSEVIDTGRLDDLGYPVYESKVVVVPQLLRQRATSPTDDGGYVSGHSNAFYLAALALAYAIPERYQELMAAAAELSHTRIVAGMHSAADVIGGRTLATALAAAALHDPQYAGLKTAARRQAAAYFQARTGTTADTLYDQAHSADLDTDAYADRVANERAVIPRLTYVLRRGGEHVGMTVPKGAEVLLETRLPYLDAAQRREVLRTTALPSGYVLLDGVEQWGRLNLFAAADGYGSFDGDVTVTLNAAEGGFNAADTWRNDIDGTGGLTKRGTGSLTLTGTNRYRGGTTLEAGTLFAGSANALGRGDVEVRGGILRLGRTSILVDDDYTQSGGVLDVMLDENSGPALTVGRTAVLSAGSALEIRLDPQHAPAPGKVLRVIDARRLNGTFGTVTVQGEPAETIYTSDSLSVRLAG